MLAQAAAARLPLEDESIHCCVTSPPYYGLRLYAGLEAQVWGGSVGCRHEWQTEAIRAQRGKIGDKSTLEGGQRHQMASRLADEFDIDVKMPGQSIGHDTCRLCGACRGHLGNEPTPELYIAHLVEIGREVWRVLRDDGVWFLNLGDSYAANRGYQVPDNKHKNVGNGFKASVPAGLKPKDKMLIPARVALALQADGWVLRQDLPWLKANPMPESVTDRPTTAHEYIFVLAKSGRVYWDAEAVKRASTEQTGQAANFSRGNGKVYKAETIPNQGYAQHREGRESSPSSTRQFRTTDPWLDSLDLAIAQIQAQLDHLQIIRDTGGMLEPEGEPLALFTALKGYSGAHYATFPLEMILPLIKAATSEAGCCPICGRQWVRVAKKPDFSQQPKRKANKLEGQMISKGTQYLTSAGQAWQAWRTQNPDITLGWRPACTCPAHEPIPAIVLDPFTGSGTVGEACRKLGRRFIGLDLSATYLAENAAARAEQKTTEAGLEMARQKRPKMSKEIARQTEAGQLGF